MGNLCGGGFKVAGGEDPSGGDIQNDVKVLLLGAGESGKSTIFKQMRIIHERGYSADELRDFKFIVYANIIKNMKALVDACLHMNIGVENAQNKERATKIADLEDDFVMYVQKIWNSELGHDIQKLWQDPGIKKAFAKRNQFQLDDSTQYYMNDLDRICSDNYMPTEEDVLWARVKTTGIIEVRCTFGGKHIKLVDVGGQRNERRKWFNVFSDVDALIFVISLAEYDLKCYEDNETPRMKESLELFSETINSKFFMNTPIILFMNKVDTFKEKLPNSHLNVMFPEYNGPMDYDSTYNFIREKYEDCNKFKDERKIYAFPTCAMDKNQIQNVFDSIKDKFNKRPSTV